MEPATMKEIESASEVTQSCLILCDSTDYSPSSFSVHGILQARILEWVSISFSRGSSWPRDQIWVSCIAGRLFTIWATREAQRSPVFTGTNPKRNLSPTCDKQHVLEVQEKFHQTKSGSTQLSGDPQMANMLANVNFILFFLVFCKENLLFKAYH